MWMEYLPSAHPPRTPFLTLAGRYVAVILMNIMEFGDQTGTGKIDATDIFVHHFIDANWYDVALTRTNSTVTAVFTGSIAGAFGGKSLRSRHEGQRSTQATGARELDDVRLILDQASVRWNCSRFALEIVYTSNDSSNQTASHKVVYPGTDKFSPGVNTIERTSGSDTYMEWRPVAYTAPDAGDAAFTHANTGIFADITIDFNHKAAEGGVPYSLLLGLTGAAHLTHFNISFGQPNDGYYNSTKFLEWTSQIGTGQPQLDPADPVNPPSDHDSKPGMCAGIGCGVGAAVLIGMILALFLYKRAQGRRHDGSLPVSKTTTTYTKLWIETNTIAARMPAGNPHNSQDF